MRTTIDPGIDRPTIFLLDHIVYSHVQMGENILP